VISRCQRFEFHLLEADLLAAHLAKISREIDFSIDEETCTLLARLAEGSARDALGLLEQCRAYGNEGVVYEEALEILGLTHPELSYRLFTAVVEEQIGDGLAIINEVVSRGRDLHRFLRELILYLRKLLILQSGQDGEKALLEVPGLRPYLLKQKGMFDHTVILEMLEILQQLTFQMKGASQPQFHLELAFLRLIRAYRLGRYLSSGDLFRRLEELEEKLQSGDLSLQPSMPLKGVEDKERREQKDDLSPSRDETPIDEPPWDEASPPAIDSVSPPPGEKTEEKKNRLSFRKEGAAPLISPINGYVPLKGVEDKKRRDPEDDLPPPWDDAPIGNPPWDEIPIDNSPLDEPPWDDTPTPWDEAPPASPVSANKAAPKSEEPPKSEKPAESAFSFKSLIKSGERGAVAPPNESSSIIAEVPSKEYSSIEISDSPPPPPSAAAAAKSPARSRSNKKTSKDLAGSGHEEKDPYIQQVLDIFNGHLIDP